MARPLRIQYPDACYHVTCRGNEQKEIFRDQEDLDVFFLKLARSLNIYSVRLAAYACMPNHFHLLVSTPEGNLSEFMRHFNISYTGAFNRRHDRVGHLYQGRYKAFLIDADNYLLEVTRYIHLNPLRMQSKESPEKKWKDLLRSDRTSLPGYTNRRKRNDFIDYTMVLQHFGGDTDAAGTEYVRFVQEGLRQEATRLAERGKGAGIIGDEPFIEGIKPLLNKNRKALREQPAFRELVKAVEPDALMARYATLVGIKREDLAAKGRQSVERAMLMELLYRLCRMTQPKIGELLGGIDYSAVSQARKRFLSKIQNDPELKMKFNQIQTELT